MICSFVSWELRRCDQTLTVRTRDVNHCTTLAVEVPARVDLDPSGAGIQRDCILVAATECRIPRTDVIIHTRPDGWELTGPGGHSIARWKRRDVPASWASGPCEALMAGCSIPLADILVYTQYLAPCESPVVVRTHRDRIEFSTRSEFADMEITHDTAIPVASSGLSCPVSLKYLRALTGFLETIDHLVLTIRSDECVQLYSRLPAGQMCICLYRIKY